ncbi:uncharacterized protein PAC_18804 [Phialocephala subalpina]|uniref:Uncharacterized protein n=1 Tax=Phialocephala subalpina TaxID=576137 RepID=A0A1L7XV40_9HELO|nr:uncharacterized protein PAC_18804 [Phialocephala subalpina]
MGNATSTLASHLVAECASPLANSSLNCLTTFKDDSNSTVAFFGNVALGAFQPDPDVAGIGTIVSFVLPSTVLLLCSLLIILSRLVVVGGTAKNPDEPPEFLKKIPIPRPAPRPEYKASQFEMWMKDRFRHQTSPTTPHHSHPLPDLAPTALPQHKPLNPFGSPPNANHVPLLYHLPYQYPIHSTPTPTYNVPTTPAAPDNTSSHEPSLTPYTSDVPPAKILKRAHAYYDILEAIIFCISDGQILLSLAFSFSFLISARCTTSQYHFQLGLNLWLTATTGAVLAFAIVRNYFRTFYSGLFRLVALIGSLIFSLGLPLILQVNSGFASETTPSDSRNNSQIFLNALCFMDPSFRSVVVDDQINNTAVIGSCTTHPELSQEFVSWVVICIIWAIIVLGRFGLSATSLFQGDYSSPDPDAGSRVELTFWCFLMLVWSFALGVFSYRTNLILNLHRWVANSPWIEDPGAETHVRGFGQYAAIFSMACIILAALDQNVSRKNKLEE